MTADASRITADATSHRRSRALAITAAGSVVVLFAAYVFFLHTGRGQNLDELAKAGRVTALPRAAEASNSVLDTVSVVSLALVGGSIALAALLRDRFRLAVAALVTILGACLSTEILKRVVFTRPDLLAVGGSPNTFPSGHATVGMVLSLALIMVSPQRHRAAATVVAAIVGVSLGVSVVTAGWHRPSDSVGAFAVSLAWAAGSTAYLLYRHGAGDDVSRRFGTRTLQLLLGVGIVLAVGVTLIVIGTYALRGDLNLVREMRRSYVAATTSIAAVGVLTVLWFNWLLRGLTLDPSRGDDLRNGPSNS